MMRTMRLAKLSICPCGYSVLKDHIGIGTPYMIDDSTIRSGFRYRCGRCGLVQLNVKVVNAYDEGLNRMSPLPYSLFGEKE